VKRGRPEKPFRASVIIIINLASDVLIGQFSHPGHSRISGLNSISIHIPFGSICPQKRLPELLQAPEVSSERDQGGLIHIRPVVILFKPKNKN
jgi:hypothetical protein